MFYLVAAVVCSTILAILFKLFGKHNIDTFQAIVFNYITCFTVGCIALGGLPFEAGFWQQPYFPYALGLGIFFITGFNIQAACVRLMGMTTTAVLQRMSLIVTVIFAILTLGESYNLLKILGIVAALGAIFFTNYEPNTKTEQSSYKSMKENWWILIPVLTFVTNAIIDSTLLYLDKRVMNGSGGGLNFTTFLFGTAGILGIIAALVGYATKRLQFSWRYVVAGVVLGIPNFGSIYFILKALATGFEGSAMFPIMNVGIIVLTTFVAYLLLSEKLSLFKLIGIALAIIAIVLIAFSSN
ncbi:MAG: EamA family transporter [Saprospiraceae bacterium]|nr:EamA family transporter [Saprospiraceae bacterium]MBP7699788.1 EamA family transporter [Saprospiraceae bacterium]